MPFDTTPDCFLPTKDTKEVLQQLFLGVVPIILRLLPIILRLLKDNLLFSNYSGNNLPEPIKIAAEFNEGAWFHAASYTRSIAVRLFSKGSGSQGIGSTCVLSASHFFTPEMSSETHPSSLSRSPCCLVLSIILVEPRAHTQHGN